MVVFNKVIKRRKAIKKWLVRLNGHSHPNDYYRLMGIYHASIFGLCFYDVSDKVKESEKEIFEMGKKWPKAIKP